MTKSDEEEAARLRGEAILEYVLAAAVKANVDRLPVKEAARNIMAWLRSEAPSHEHVQLLIDTLREIVHPENWPDRRDITLLVHQEVLERLLETAE